MEAAEKPLMMKKNTSCDREMAIQEISRGYELIKQIRSIPFLGHETLFEEALQALTVAITNLKSSSTSLSDQGSEPSNEIKNFSSGSRKRRLRSSADNPWTKITYAPHDDGHQWRKYGHKIIKKSKLSRSYYRCTYKEQGCLARKHVQQKDCNIDPPLFSVTYLEKHTCKCNNYPMISQQMTVLDKLVPIEPNFFSFESNANHHVFSTKENTLLLHTSLKASTTSQQDPEQERVDLQNKNIDNENMESVANSIDQYAMLNTSLQEDTIPAGECLSPPWLHTLCMDDLMESFFGSDEEY